MTRKTPYFRCCRVVAFLHPVLSGARARAGFGLAEAIVAITVMGVGILGVAAMGGAASRLAHIAAVRSAQVVAAGSTLERAPAQAWGDLAVRIDTVGVAAGLIEIRVTVTGSGSADERMWVTRRSSGGP